MMELKLSHQEKHREGYFKYPKIPVADLVGVPIDPNNWVEVFEKLDGGNCQVRKVKGKLLHGSRGQWITGANKDRVEWFKKFNKWFYPNYHLHKLPENLVVFAEWLGHHTINYNKEFADKFYLTDVFDFDSGRFLPYFRGVERLNKAGVRGFKISHPVARGRLGSIDLNRLVLDEPSGFYNGPKEGIVIKDYNSNSQEFFKMYHPDFAESREERSGKIDHLTKVRFRKAYFGILEEFGSAALGVNRIVDAVVQNITEEYKQNYDPKEVKKRLEYYIVFDKMPSSWKELLTKK